MHGPVHVCDSVARACDSHMVDSCMHDPVCACACM